MTEPPTPATLPPPLAAPPPAPGAPGGPEAPGGRVPRTAIVAGAVTALALAAGVWWTVSDGDPADHVRITGSETADSDAKGKGKGTCDDSDEYQYNDCSAYEVKYKITNPGGPPANYTVTVTAFDDDGDFIGQSEFVTRHVAGGKTETETSEFSAYAMEDGRTVEEIDRVTVAHVQRVELTD